MVRTTDEQQLTQILDLVREMLGPDVAGAYLHGSGAFGGLQPRSDVDVLVVSRRSLTPVRTPAGAGWGPLGGAPKATPARSS